MAHNNILHKGVVIQSEGNKYKIQLVDEIHCQSCSIKSSCGLRDDETKIVNTFSNNNFEKGSKVMVVMKQKKAFVAVLLAYVIPFLILMLSLAVFMALSYAELQAAIFSLLLTALYYLLLWMSNGKLKSFFQFEVVKL